MSKGTGPNDWVPVTTNPGSDEPRTVEDRNGQQGEVTWNGDVGDVRDANGNSIGTMER